MTPTRQNKLLVQTILTVLRLALSKVNELATNNGEDEKIIGALKDNLDKAIMCAENME